MEKRIAMRLLVALAFILSLGFSCAAFAQTKTIETKTSRDTVTGKVTTTTDTIYSVTEDIRKINNMITINPLEFFLFYNLNFYHALSPSIAIGGGVQIPTLHDIGGFGVKAEMRFYPSEKALRGFYIAPNVSYTAISYSYSYLDDNGNFTSDNSNGSVGSVGVLLGWQWFPGDEFAIGVGLGVDYYFLSANAGGQYVNFGDYGTGAAPSLRFDIGYAWN